MHQNETMRVRLAILLALSVSSPAASQSWEGSGLDPTHDGPHYILDASTTATWDTPVLGDASHRLRLRRSGDSLALTYESTGASPAPVDLTTDFVFMPAALSNANGTVVCWTHFTGYPTDATAGGAPDPRTGSALSCRSKTTIGFSSVVRLDKQLADSRGIYLMKIEPSGSGFRVVYYEDRFGTFFNQPSDFAQRIFARTFDGVSFGPATPASL